MPKRAKSRPSASEIRRMEQDLIGRTTQTILTIMKKKGVAKAELARRLGTTNAYVTQLLAGDRNLTLRTIAGIAASLGAIPKVVLTDR